LPTVRELGNADSSAWDRLVEVLPQGNVFMESDWLQMMCETDPALRMFVFGCFGGSNNLAGGQVVVLRERGGVLYPSQWQFFYNGPVLCPRACARSNGPVLLHASKSWMRWLRQWKNTSLVLRSLSITRSRISAPSCGGAGVHRSDTTMCGALTSPTMSGGL